MKNYILIVFGILLLLLIGYINSNRHSNNYSHAEDLIHGFIIQSEIYKKNVQSYINERENSSDPQSIKTLTENIKNARQSTRSQLFLLLNNPYIKNDPALKGIIFRHVVESKMLTGGVYYIGSNGLKFDGADARGLNLNSTKLVNLSLNGVNLKGAVLKKTNVQNSDLRNVVYDRTTQWDKVIFSKSTQFSEDFNPIERGFVTK